MLHWIANNWLDPSRIAGSFHAEPNLSVIDACARERADYALKEAGKILDQGVEPDRMLSLVQNVLEIDRRFGVSIIARPPALLIDQIRTAQRRLRLAEPDQYYYPWSDLHLTVLSVRFNCSVQEMNSIAATVKGAMPELLTGLAAPNLVSPAIFADRHTVSLQFDQADNHLLKLRERLSHRLNRAGIKSEFHFSRPVAHVSIARYTRPLATDPVNWLRAVTTAQLPESVTWKVSKLYVTWGASLYGMRASNKQSEPFELSAENGWALKRRLI